MKKIILLSMVLSVFLFAKTGKEIAKDLKINPSVKAISQWKRLFKKMKKMKKYGIDKLSEEDKSKLKEYLLNHAADSDQPESAGF
jgi:flagellar biosynthesis protein FliP